LKDWVVLLNSVHDVSLSEVSKGKPDQETISSLDSVEDNLSDGDQNDLEPTQAPETTIWPQPLKEPTKKHAAIKVLKKPSIFFNHKVSIRKPLTRTILDESSSKPKYEAAATPFERYQLSKEILDMMKDPKKKEALDMENPIVKAVYETVFCDPAEEIEVERDEKHQVLEKVLAEGEFIPFNPLVTYLLGF
jgi:hypothetical protein